MSGTLRTDPVIVLGMHHSGTSILARVLHDNGVFMHATMDHDESRFFSIEVNDRLIMGGGAAWARNPIMSVDEVLLKLDAVRERIARKAYSRYVRDGYDGVSPWGFKDPRACVLLPLYLELYPDARLLHIVRNGDDVAASLARDDKSGVGRIQDAGFWKDLWRQHVGRAREYGGRHARYRELAYEDFCDHPGETMKPVFEYLALDFTPAVAAYLREQVRPLARPGVARR